MAKPKKKPEAERVQRANGAKSREQILDAVQVIAGQRGYEGTSIAAVSKLSGLPASSIYWHFADKDALIAAVIERGFAKFMLTNFDPPEDPKASRLERMTVVIERALHALLADSDFLRLGLMLVLDRRPEETAGRTLFFRVREETHRRIEAIFTYLCPELDAKGVQHLANLAVWLAQGLMISVETGIREKNLREDAKLFAAALCGAAAQLKVK